MFVWTVVGIAVDVYLHSKVSIHMTFRGLMIANDAKACLENVSYCINYDPLMLKNVLTFHFQLQKTCFERLTCSMIRKHVLR